MKRFIKRIILSNCVSFIRDVVKDFLRLFEQVLARIIYVKRQPSTYISTSCRLDIGQKLRGEKRPKLFSLNMSKGSFIEAGVTINTWIGDVSIGQSTGIGIGTIIIGPVEIGNNCSIAQNCFITGENRVHTLTSAGLFSSYEQLDIKPVKVGHGVWVGAGVIILPGVEVGDGCILAAGSVVTKNISAFSVVGGVPARLLKSNI